MPIYEYKCARCSQVSEQLRAREDRDKSLPCGACGCVKTKRLMSTFAGHSSSGSLGGGSSCGGCSKTSCAGCRR